MNWVNNSYTCDAIADPFASPELAQAWRTLQDRSRNPCLTESYEWAEASWRAIGGRDGRRLLCLVVQRGEQVVAVLPLLISAKGVCRSARPLACETDEYCPGLIDPAADPAAVRQAIMSELGARGDVDALLLPHVREDHVLAPWLASAPNSVAINAMPAHYIRRAAFGTWEAYWEQLPNRFRRNLQRLRRRLDSLGEVQVAELTDADERHAAWRWMVDQKRAWLDRKGLKSEFISSDAYFRFIDKTLDVVSPHGRRLLYALKVDGRLVAAELDNLGRRQLEAFVIAYDEAFASCAPGNHLRCEILRRTFAEGLDYDWRMGDQAYKLDWASDARQVATYVLALNARGRMLVSYFAGRQRLARHAPVNLREGLRSMLA
jgi:CelD/BcsL family acetyltransferase involved in cellulose biosynthesis